MLTKLRDFLPNMHMWLEWEIVCVFFCLFVCPTSCSLAVLCIPIPLVDEGKARVLLETSFVVPRRQKVAFPVYCLYKFGFINPVQAHLSWVLKGDRLPCFLLPLCLVVESRPSLVLVFICLPLPPPYTSFSSLVSCFSPLTPQFVV